MSTAPDAALEQVQTETLAMPGARMAMPRERGLFTAMLTPVTGARTALEVDTFTGFGAISIARGPPGGLPLCLEILTAYADLARRNLAAAGVADLVEVRVGPALHSPAGRHPPARGGDDR